MPETLQEIVEFPEPVQVSTGYGFTEGPLWHPRGYLIFSDIRRGFAYRLVPGGKPEVIRAPAGQNAGQDYQGWRTVGEAYKNGFNPTNAWTFDMHGRLLACEQGGRRILRMEPSGAFVPYADLCEGKRMNRPNDIVCRSDGNVYFSSLGGNVDQSDRQIPFNCVHRVAPDGTVSIAAPHFQFPNGLAFSPDESVLYVANSREHKHIKAFDVAADGTLSNARIFADMSSDEEGMPDGMKVDSKGRVYCAGSGGCWVFDASGRHIGIIRLPENPANCAWGGADYRTMFFTAHTSVYSLRMRTAGRQPPGAKAAA